MARSFNQVILMGNLTRDPELRTTPTGQSVCSFSHLTAVTKVPTATGKKQPTMSIALHGAR